MKKKRSQRKQLHRERKKTKFMILLISLEVLGLVLIVGLGFIYYKVSERQQVENRLEKAGVTHELLEGTNVSSNAKNNNEEIRTGKYSEVLRDQKYCRNNKIVSKDTMSEDTVTLAFAGDISFAEGYANMASLQKRGKDIRECFDEAILLEMENADIFMVNNEFPYTDRGTKTAEKTFTFRTEPENVKLLYQLGIDAVSIANNHVYDYGLQSLEDTLTTLDDAAMPYTGAGKTLEEAKKPIYFIANDRKIGIISATQIERLDNPDTPGATDDSAGTFRCWNDDTILSVVESMKQECDYVIAYIHWGTEMQTETDWAQEKQAQELADAGADLIIGDHPHILQRIDYIGDTPVIFSLGNFWFNSKAMDTGILKVTLDFEDATGTDGNVTASSEKKTANATATTGETDIRVNVQFLPARQENCTTTLLTGTEKERVLQEMRAISPNVTIDEEGNVTAR